MAHNHINYEVVSLISAVVCPRCGVYLSSRFSSEHNAYHDQLDELLSSAGASPQPIKKSSPRRSTSKKASSDA